MLQHLHSHHTDADIFSFFPQCIRKDCDGIRPDGQVLQMSLPESAALDEAYALRVTRPTSALRELMKTIVPDLRLRMYGKNALVIFTWPK